MEFKTLCDFFESVRNCQLASEKLAIVKQFLSKVKNEHNPDNVFQILRLVIPQMDSYRRSYNMKEFKIAKTIIKMLGHAAGAETQLTEYYKVSGKGIDFAEVVGSVLRKHISNPLSKLTIDNLNAYLDKIALRDSDATLDNDMVELFRKCTVLEMKWIIRIILKDLKLGLGNNSVLRCFHSGAVDLYTTNSSLKEVCSQLSKSAEQSGSSIQLFKPFRPMLCKSINQGNFRKQIIENKKYFVEEKFDGERFQLHKNLGEFKYFSRNGVDYTQLFGNTCNNGTLTPYLADVFGSDVKNIILDGEMMLYSVKDKSFGSKGVNVDVKSLTTCDSYQPCYVVYDILYLNNRPLHEITLEERRMLIAQNIRKQIPGSFVVSAQNETYSTETVLHYLNETVDKKTEGIVLKIPESTYKFANRNGGWFKMKLEYFESGVSDLDLVLMGGCCEKSKRFQSFIVGVFSGTRDNMTYSSFAKIKSGFSMSDLDKLNEKLKTDGKRFKRKDFESDSRVPLLFNKEKPDYWIAPEKSLVFKVRASELVLSERDLYVTPYTLRFARVLEIRTDKRPEECLSLAELEELCHSKDPVIKLHTTYISEVPDVTQHRSKKVKTVNVSITTIGRTELLKGLKFYVISDKQNLPRHVAESQIATSGGMVVLKGDVQKHLDTINIMLVGNDTAFPKTNKVMSYDVIRLDWLERVLKAGKLLKYELSEIISLGMKNNIKLCSLSSNRDQYGDSYNRSITVGDLRKIMNIMDEQGV